MTQAMFCGGGNVIPRTTGYMGLDIMGCRPYGFALATMSGGYIGEKGQEGVLPPRD